MSKLWDKLKNSIFLTTNFKNIDILYYLNNVTWINDQRINIQWIDIDNIKNVLSIVFLWIYYYVRISFKKYIFIFRRASIRW